MIPAAPRLDFLNLLDSTWLAVNVVSEYVVAGFSPRSSALNVAFMRAPNAG